MASHPAGGGNPSALPEEARAYGALPRLRLSRPAPGVRDHERSAPVSGPAPGPHAAQELPDHAALHQHGHADGRGGRETVRTRRAEGEDGGRVRRVAAHEGYMRVSVLSSVLISHKPRYFSVPLLGLEPKTR